MSIDFESLRKAADEAIEKAVKAHSIAINDLTEQQTVQVFKQAVACGDFTRLVRVDNQAQTVIYIPFAREQELEFKLARARECLKEAKSALHELSCYDGRFYERQCPGLLENIDACLMEP